MGVATHVAWVLPASESAVARARRVLDRIAPLSRPELLVAAVRTGARRRSARSRDLAEDRRAPLVLMPEVRDFLDMPVLAIADEAALTLQAIGGLLQR